MTLDVDGALLLERGHPPYRTFALPCDMPMAVGAGDTYVAALTLALAAGAESTAAADLAAAAAAVVVRKSGTACCTVDELVEQLVPSSRVTRDRLQLASRTTLYREEGRRIVLTSGCFDVLHRGHVTYLSRAKALGDLLIVGVNSDETVRALKGPERPINGLEDRMQLLASLSCVDHVVPFPEETPTELIRCLRPNLFVKGGDYAEQHLPEAAAVDEVGGRIVILPFLEGYSTTQLVHRMHELAVASSS